MRVLCLKSNPKNYSCRSYLILGDWSLVQDLNTLIDPGPDDYVITEIEKIYTGVGKKPVDQIVLTHNHFDHAAGNLAVKKYFGARTLAAHPAPDVDQILKDADKIKIADREFEVIKSSIHSEDSICLYCRDERTLFSGDTPVRIIADSSFSNEHLSFFKRLNSLPLQTVYSGHDPPITQDVPQIISKSLDKVQSAFK